MLSSSARNRTKSLVSYKIGPWRRGKIRVLAARSENGDHSDRADVRFVRRSIQIYDAHVVDLYQWICARYLIGMKGAETKAKRS